MDRREMNRSIFQDTERMCKTDAELSAVTKISVANQRFIAEAEVIPTPELNIYKKANVDRKLFSKIRNNMDYRPSKTTALAFAFALELDVEETKDFISRAGFALSHSSKFDVIVEYFLVNRNYNVFELNEVLFAFDQPLIGA